MIFFFQVTVVTGGSDLVNEGTCLHCLYNIKTPTDFLLLSVELSLNFALNKARLHG